MSHQKKHVLLFLNICTYMGLLQIIWKPLAVVIHNLKTGLFGNQMELCVLIVKVYITWTAQQNCRSSVSLDFKQQNVTYVLSALWQHLSLCPMY